jgi:DNA transformation protein
MPVSTDYLAYVIEQLSQCVRVRTRRMFGGIGLYHEHWFFALIDDDQLYFKVNDATRNDFMVRGSQPFCPIADDSKTVTLGYYTVPAEVLEDIDELKPWALKAIAVAQSAPQRKPRSQMSRARKSGARKKQ